MLLRRTAVSASGMFAFLSSGFSSRPSLTGARVFAFDRHAHVCTPAREKEREFWKEHPLKSISCYALLRDVFSFVPHFSMTGAQLC